LSQLNCQIGEKEKEKRFFLAQKFAPVLNNFVANSITFKKEITKFLKKI